MSPRHARHSFRNLIAGGRDRLEQRKKEVISKKQPKVKPVFGRPLSKVPLHLPTEFDAISNINCHNSLEKEVPEFVVRCLKRIETMSTFDGLYRINGDAGNVQKLKYNLYAQVNLYQCLKHTDFVNN